MYVICIFMYDIQTLKIASDNLKTNVRLKFHLQATDKISPQGNAPRQLHKGQKVGPSLAHF